MSEKKGPSATEKGKELTPITPPSGEIAEKSGPAEKLRRKFGEIKAKVKETEEKIVLTISFVKEEPEGPETAVPVSAETLKADIEELSWQTLSPAEYLLRGSQILQGAKVTLKQYDQQVLAVEEKSSPLTNRQQEIDMELQRIDNLSIIRRVFSLPQRGRLNGQRERLARELQELETEKAEIETEGTLVRALASPIKQRCGEIVLSEVDQAIRGLREEYVTFIKGVLSDDQILDEVREAYIQAEIAPVVERKRKVKKSEKEDFYSTLRAAFHAKDWEERLTLWQNMDRFWGRGKFYIEVQDSCRKLILDKIDEAVVIQLLAHVAAEDFESLNARVLKENPPPELSSHISTIIIRAKEPKETWEEGVKVYHMGFQEFDPKKPPSSSTYMDFWVAMKRSPAFSSVFSETTQALDSQFYQGHLDHSLSDSGGAYIGCLAFYPTPEAIRNLVLIAGADAQQHRTIHANSVLTSLAQRKDWGPLLEAALEKYPSLKKARPILAKWNLPDDYGNHPDIQRVASKFSLEIYQDSKLNERARKLAREALPNEVLLELLKSRGLISPAETKTLNSASKLLHRVEKKRGSSGPYISDWKLNQAVRENAFVLESEEATTDNKEACQKKLGRLVILAQRIMANKKSLAVLNYLSSDELISLLQGPAVEDKNVTLLLGAYRDCPLLLEIDELIPFLTNFQTPERLSLLNQIAKEALPLLKDYLMREFLLGTPGLVQELADFLFFENLAKGNFAGLEEEKDYSLGERILRLKSQKIIFGSEVASLFVYSYLSHMFPYSQTEEEPKVNEQNWKQLLTAFIFIQTGDYHQGVALDLDSSEAIKALFYDPKVKDFCRDKFWGMWLSYLRRRKPESFPLTMTLLADYISLRGGAGPLKHIGALGIFIHNLQESFLSPTTAEITKEEIVQRLGELEARFGREHWSYEDRSFFYTISLDILKAAPSLYSEFLEVLGGLTNPQEFKKFSQELFPLYQVQLLLLEKEGAGLYTPKSLARLRKGLKFFSSELDKISPDKRTDELIKEKERLVSEIRESFKSRFGIIKTPENFTPESIRSLTNIVRYMANIHGRNADKEAILAFYLALMLNGDWDALRKGRTIDPALYLEQGKVFFIKNFLARRSEFDPLTAEALGINPEELSIFQTLLQEETEQVVYGVVKTIDEKLGEVIRGIKELTDEDAYPEVLDKQMLRLFLSFGSSSVNTVLGKTYQQLAGKPVALSEEERRIQKELQAVFEKNNLTWGPNGIKSIQVRSRQISLVVNMVEYTEKTQAGAEIEELRRRLNPPPDIVKVFKSLGEEFTPSSGAMALTEDLSYLENLVVKRDKDLTPQEMKLVRDYLESIHAQMGKLETIFADVQKRFETLRGSASANPLLKARFDELQRIITMESSVQSITSRMTNDLNLIIENIRACLACVVSASNNDTNLTFGDPNKFLIISTFSSQKGSLADQILFVCPVAFPDGTKEISFVFDKIYGATSSDVFVNHVATVLKKYRQIKTRFPGAKLSLFVTNAALLSAGISAPLLVEKLKQVAGISLISGEIDNLQVIVPVSAAGRHYIEFGGDIGKAGEVSGLIIR